MLLPFDVNEHFRARWNVHARADLDAGTLVSDDRLQRDTAGAAGLPSFRLGGEELVVVSIPAPRVPEDRLTAAEKEVVEGIAQGLSNAAIAERREVSPSTVANQIASIYRKLGVGSRTELLARLVSEGRGG